VTLMISYNGVDVKGLVSRFNPEPGYSAGMSLLETYF